MKRLVISSIAFAVLAASVTGCAAAPDEAVADSAPGESEESAVSTDDEIRASCSSPRRYFVTYADGRACEPIVGRRGQWIPEKLFADAPSDVQASTCAYRWSGAKYSRADGAAIIAKVGDAGGLAPACGTSSEPDVGRLQPIPHVDVFGHAGSVGCDVCGVLRRGRVWVILPPDKIAVKQFEVQLSNGETRAFQIQSTDARALSMTLPAPPTGTTYKQGRVHIY